MSRFWDAGGNWLLFLLAFLAIEGGAILAHRRTLSETFWAAEGALRATLDVGACLLCVVLLAHLVARQWR